MSELNEENKHTYDNGFHPKEVKLDENYKLYRTNLFFRFRSKLAILICKFIFFFPKTLVWGFKVKGKKNKKYINSSCIISNHTHQMDAFMIVTSISLKRIYITMLETNLGFGIVSGIFRLGGAVPIPRDMKLLKKFNKETKDVINKGYNVLFYPEAALMPFCDHIRNFLPGVFHYSIDTTNKIIPLVITYHKPKGLYKLTRRKKPCIHLNILDPYYIEDLGNKKLTIEKAKTDLEDIMSNYFNKNSDYFI